MRCLVETGLCFDKFSAVVLASRVGPNWANRTGRGGQTNSRRQSQFIYEAQLQKGRRVSRTAMH